MSGEPGGPAGGRQAGPAAAAPSSVPGFGRRVLAAGLAGLLGPRVASGVIAGASAQAPQPGESSETIRVTLLGTGTPMPSGERFGNSTLVEAGGQRLLFDFGRGVSIRLWQLRLPLGSIDAHFLTHFHSDHLGGLPDLWLTGWLRPPYGQRNAPFLLYGPPGTAQLAQGLRTAFAQDIATRLADERSPEAGIAFDAREVPPGVAYERDGLRVTAFANDHGELVRPSYGYRIEWRGRSVVLSGDTRYSPEVVRQGRGADLLLHCVTLIPPALLAGNPGYRAVYDHLASPADAARTLAEARPSLGALSHIGLNGEATVEDLVRALRAGYDGPLVVGEDLLAFEIGAQGTVTYRRGRP
ncbi:MBL fold metallo-hydrolase [Roseomonas sp. NAR14]|uniref:MBL fold metallo-hydrolase n=1 Tax=Roseomonas acroporae TaxID=2937791 RepID=A0A9X1YIS5_9PROT|nr:MBL fold metallo-hydrolase [Roseomonas acroporae]MCK8786946.1 MBL fold metallo-hydrolase [Roseomonas acroporae]